ncbi:N/A [soil metagenome]
MSGASREQGAICIDGYNLALPKGTGIATYGRTLMSTLSGMGAPAEVLFGTLTKRSPTNSVNAERIANGDEGDKYVGRQAYFWRTVASGLGRPAHPVMPAAETNWGAGRRPEARRYWLSPSLYRFSLRAFKKYGVGTPVRFRATAQMAAPAVMHWTSPLPVRAVGIPNICTIHDLIPITHPHLTTGDPEAFRALCRQAVSRADHIAVVSETTRRDLVERIGVSEDHITTTYQAVRRPDNLVEVEVAARDLRDDLGLSWKGYLLHFGAIEPKKNLGRIVEAYLASGIATPLVLVGGRAWMSEGETALLDKIKREGGRAAERIHQYGYLQAGALTSLIRGAKATLFPSVYEGFGLPVVESMSLGTAVMTSTAGSLPEISGGAALLVDPYDVGAMAKAIRTLDADDGLRDELATQGLIRADDFTLEAYARRLRTLYAKVGVVLHDGNFG